MNYFAKGKKKRRKNIVLKFAFPMRNFEDTLRFDSRKNKKNFYFVFKFFNSDGQSSDGN